MWPKLQLQQEKPHWLRLDFDLMQESSDEGEGDDDNRSSVDKEVSCFVIAWSVNQPQSLLDDEENNG